MRYVITMRHEFVDNVPDILHDGVLYISNEYSTAVHKCCCGCGREVVTPLGSLDWTVKIEHCGVSLYPSIGNWSFECQSHYWINQGCVCWAEQWSEAQIKWGRLNDRLARHIHYDDTSRKVIKWQRFWSWLRQFITRL